MLSDEQKNTIADSLALAIQDAAVRQSRPGDTHYKVVIGDVTDGVVIVFARGAVGMDAGWIPLEGG